MTAFDVSYCYYMLRTALWIRRRARLFVIGKGLCLPSLYDKLSINLVKSREMSSDEFWQAL